MTRGERMDRTWTKLWRRSIVLVGFVLLFPLIVWETYRESDVENPNPWRTSLKGSWFSFVEFMKDPLEGPLR